MRIQAINFFVFLLGTIKDHLLASKRFDNRQLGSSSKYTPLVIRGVSDNVDVNGDEAGDQWPSMDVLRAGFLIGHAGGAVFDFYDALFLPCNLHRFVSLTCPLVFCPNSWTWAPRCSDMGPAKLRDNCPSGRECLCTWVQTNNTLICQDNAKRLYRLNISLTYTHNRALDHQPPGKLWRYACASHCKTTEIRSHTATSAISSCQPPRSGLKCPNQPGRYVLWGFCSGAVVVWLGNCHMRDGQKAWSQYWSGI